MNNHWKAVLAGSLALCAWANLTSAAEPLVQFPATDAAWTIDFTDSHASPAPPPTASGQKAPATKKARKIEVMQVGGVRRTRFTWTDGQTMEEWVIPAASRIFKEYPNGAVFPVESNKMEVKIENFNCPSDESAFSWIKPDSLQEKDPVNMLGKTCYHYADTVVEPSTEGHLGSATAQKPVKWQAWIDTKTLLPVVLDTQTSRCVFTFLPPPAGPLEIPPKFKQEITYYKHTMGLP